MLVEGKVAVVTGAGQGIGESYAHALASEGAAVVVAEINPEHGQKVADDLVALGHRALFVPTDVSSRESTDAMARQAAEAFGTIDILVNNAAIYYGLQYEALEDIDEAIWDRVMNVNVKGVWMTIRAALPYLRKQGGVVVNQSSTATYFTAPRRMNYNVSKAAVITITKTLAKELAPDGIRVNAIAPGAIYTDATKQGVPQATLDRLKDAVLIKDFGEVDDLNGTLLFLVSKLGENITGQTLVVDGGVVLQG